MLFFQQRSFVAYIPTGNNYLSNPSTLSVTKMSNPPLKCFSGNWTLEYQYQ